MEAATTISGQILSELSKWARLEAERIQLLAENTQLQSKWALLRAERVQLEAKRAFLEAESVRLLQENIQLESMLDFLKAVQAQSGQNSRSFLGFWKLCHESLVVFPRLARFARNIMSNKQTQPPPVAELDRTVDSNSLRHKARVMNKDIFVEINHDKPPHPFEEASGDLVIDMDKDVDDVESIQEGLHLTVRESAEQALPEIELTLLEWRDEEDTVGERTRGICRSYLNMLLDQISRW
ncbi:MAG: hypothetical protein Q9220_006160 [cf. Caloplaca sp. 1 TL-2023]